jgi:hypothetical protein
MIKRADRRWWGYGAGAHRSLRRDQSLGRNDIRCWEALLPRGSQSAAHEGASLRGRTEFMDGMHFNSMKLRVAVEHWPLITPFRITGYTWHALDAVVVSFEQRFRANQSNAV